MIYSLYSNNYIESRDVNDVKVNHGSLQSDWRWRQHNDKDDVPQLAENLAPRLQKQFFLVINVKMPTTVGI